MSRTLLMSGIIALCTTASGVAEPILVAELTLEVPGVFTVGAELPSAVPFDFFADAGVENAHWGQAVTLADIGQTFVAPPDIVAPFRGILATPNPVLGGSIGVFPSVVPYFAPVNDIPPPPIDLNTGKRLVLQQLVAELTDYRISGLERVVHDAVLDWVPTGEGRYFHIGGKQSIRFLGSPIPEPSTGKLLVLCFAAMHLKTRP